MGRSRKSLPAMLLALATVGGCKEQPTGVDRSGPDSERTVSRVVAPPGVTSWSSAEVKVVHEISKDWNRHGANSTFEQVAVEIWVHGRSEPDGIYTPPTLPRRLQHLRVFAPIVVESYRAKRTWGLGDKTVRRIRNRPYDLTVSRTGEWLAFRAGKDPWLPIHAESLLLCRHLPIEGEEPDWNAIPVARDLVLDILKHAMGEEGPLGLDHTDEVDATYGYSTWVRHGSETTPTELWAAGNWARAHPEDDGVQSVVADLMLSSPYRDSLMIFRENLAQAAITHPDIRRRLFSQISDRAASPGAVREAAVALAERPDIALQGALSQWFLDDLAGELTADGESDSIVGDMAWALARTTSHLGAVDEATEAAALAMVRAGAPDSSEPRFAHRRMQAYGAFILGMAASDASMTALARLAAERPAWEGAVSWPPTFADVGSDDPSVVPSSWAQAALAETAGHAANRRRLERHLLEPSTPPGTLRTTVIALAKHPDQELQQLLSEWILTRLEDDLAVLARDEGAFVADTVAWALAKSSQHVGEVDDLTEKAALAMARAEASRETRRTLGFRSIVGYAVHILDVSGSEAAVAMLEAVAAEAPSWEDPVDWPPTYTDVGRESPRSIEPVFWARAALEARVAGR